MLDYFIVINSAIVIIFLLVGLVVITQNSKTAINRLFFAFTITLSTWIMANYYSNNFEISKSLALFANHLVLFSPGVVLVFLISFARGVAGLKTATPRWLAYILITTLIYASALTPLVVKGIEKQGNVYAIEFGPLSALYFLTLITNMVLVVVILLKQKHKSQGDQKRRISALLNGVTAFLGVNLATNTLLPALGGSFAFTNLGPISAVFVIYALLYSILKHKLFDLRLLVVRSLAYVFSLGTIALLFVFISFTATSLLFDKNNLDAGNVLLLYTFFAVFLAIAFPPLKRFFDTTTAKLFYRDLYDPQSLMDRFNKTLVSTYDLNQLLKRAANVIQEDIKPLYTFFGIKETSTNNRRIIGTKGHPAFTNDEIKFIRNLTPTMGRKIIVTDLLEPQYEKMKGILRDKNVSVVARLASSNSEEGVGYLVLGPKKSGNVYSDQDIKIIEIIANELVLAIQNSLRFEEIQNFNLTLQEKVNDATHKLRRTNEKLKALDETKDDFISMASHQLRTPLTSVKGYISMVLEEDAGKITSMQREMLGQAFFSSQRMVYLIADLLNVSRLKTGKFIIERAPIHLDQIVEQELRQLQETAAARSLTLEFLKPDSFPTMMLDETKTRQIIMNFIDNAIYYTPAGGHIKVKLVNNEQTVELRVEDNGIGVPKMEQAHLFTKFYRAGNARQARPDGTGLGLFMAKKVIVAQGGSILFESEEGKGSTFGFVFSKSWAAEEAPHEVPAAKELDVVTPPKT